MFRSRRQFWDDSPSLSSRGDVGVRAGIGLAVDRGGYRSVEYDVLTKLGSTTHAKKPIIHPAKNPTAKVKVVAWC